MVVDLLRLEPALGQQVAERAAEGLEALPHAAIGRIDDVIEDQVPLEGDVRIPVQRYQAAIILFQDGRDRLRCRRGGGKDCRGVAALHHP